MFWNKIRLINFFTINLQNELLIEELKGTFSIQGEILDVIELDLCNHILLQVKISQNISKNEIFLTLHDEFIGIIYGSHSENLIQFHKKRRKQIPYNNLKVKELKKI